VSLAEERIELNEHQVIDELVEDNLKTSWSRDGTARRGQHAKHHGCTEATFVVVDPVPEGLAHGVFQPGRKYNAHMRFSNGGQQDDRKNDARGLAIKLLDVEETKMLPGQGDANEQDFILVDFPVYFTSTMKDYVAFNRHFTRLLDLRVNGFSVKRALLAGWGLISLVAFHRKTFKAARAFAGRQVGTPLSLTYHSTTPYLLGPDNAVKYKVIGKAKEVAPTLDEHGLRDALWSRLTDAPAAFEFGVVLQSDAAVHPIEDPSIDWEVNGAEYVKLADITLPKQENSAEKDALAHRLKFNPWMCLPAHKPLGGINRARRQIYDAMSRIRNDDRG